MAADRDENLARDGVQDEEGCRDAAKPRERLQEPLRRDLHQAKACRTDEQRHEEPARVAHAERIDEPERDQTEQPVVAARHLHGHAGTEQSVAEGQHAAYEVIAQAVEFGALGAAEHLHQRAHRHQTHRPAPVAAVEQHAVDDVELHHQPEEPVGTRPDDAVAMAHDAVGIFQQVVEQSQLCHDVEQLVAVAARRDGVDQHEQRKADNHHAEQLHEVRAQELQALSAESLQSRPHLVFHHQPVGTQEEEHGHAVVAEERQQVERQVPVGRRQDATQSAGVVLVEEVFVFANDARQPVAVVMQHDAQDGHTAQCVALSSCQKFRSHLNSKL